MRSNFGTSLGLPTMPPAAPPAAAPPAAAATPVVPVTSQPLGDSDMDDDSIVAIASEPAVDLLAMSPSDGLVESPSAFGYISESQAISGGLSIATTPYRAATEGHDLRPLSDDPVTDDQGDDLLADILAESPLVVPL